MLYKVLNEDGTAFYGGTGRWHLPQNGQSGEWMPRIEGDLVPCENGYHLCRTQDLVEWLGPAIYEAECRTQDLVTCDDKIVVRQARLIRRLPWDDRTARLFVCDCAERVAHITKDERSRNTIAVSRRYAFGLVTKDQLAAARAAARGAARDAARGAARDAAWDAARAAAWAAAWDAAWDAARAATRDAAWDAARAAAWDAAWAPAWAAAWAAERRWQTKRLLWYLDGHCPDGPKYSIEGWEVQDE